ncbi:MAG: WD40 repeat domain-containing protein [Deltaproteobacteria bacterium]|nr:MAG: WD40 repeat domain-containing protein [Deltaproteobacteria bacterium]
MISDDDSSSSGLARSPERRSPPRHACVQGYSTKCQAPLIASFGTSADRTAQIWDAASGARLAPPLIHRGAVTSAAFSPDGTRVLTTSADHTARIWSAIGGMPLSPPLQHEGAVNDGAFSPDGTRIVTASADHAARIWNALSGQLLSQALHDDVVWSAAFSPDGSCIVTASKDHTAAIWDVASGRPIVPLLQHCADVTGAVFSPDGTRILTASWDYTARVWRLPLAAGTVRDWADLVERAGAEPLASDLLRGTGIPAARRR